MFHQRPSIVRLLRGAKGISSVSCTLDKALLNRRLSKRLGILVPCSNTNMEPDLHMLAPSDVSLHFSRISYDVEAIPDAKAMTDLVQDPSVSTSLESLAAASVDVIAFGCTSATLANGPLFDAELKASIEQQTGITAVTAAGALVEALQSIGARRIAFASPYVPDLHQQAVQFLEKSGFSVVAEGAFDQEVSSLEQSLLTPEHVIGLSLETMLSAKSTPDALVISCTEFRALEAVHTLEKLLGIPVIVSNQALMHSCLKRVKHVGTRSVHAGGHLFHQQPLSKPTRTSQHSDYIQLPVKEGFDLDVGQPSPSLLLPDLVLQSGGHVNRSPEFLQYANQQGDPEFRRQLAGFLSSQTGESVDEESLLVTSGNSSALALVGSYVHSLARSHGNLKPVCIVETPTYGMLPQIMENCGFEVIEVQVDEDGLDVDQVRRLVQDESLHISLVAVIPSNHNPTGANLSTSRRQQLINLAKKHDFYILADEAYQLLTFPPDTLSTSMAHDDTSDSGVVFTLGTFSKILAPSLRLGWVQAKPELTIKLKNHPVLGSGGGMNPLVAGLVEPLLPFKLPLHLATLRSTLCTRRHAMVEAMQEYFPQAQLAVDTNGGYFLWYSLPQGLSATELAAQAKADKHITFRAGPRCRASDSMMRLCFAFHTKEEISEAIEQLGQVACSMFTGSRNPNPNPNRDFDPEGKTPREGDHDRKDVPVKAIFDSLYTSLLPCDYVKELCLKLDYLLPRLAVDQFRPYVDAVLQSRADPDKPLTVTDVLSCHGLCSAHLKHRNWDDLMDKWKDPATCLEPLPEDEYSAQFNICLVDGQPKPLEFAQKVGLAGHAFPGALDDILSPDLAGFLRNESDLMLMCGAVSYLSRKAVSNILAESFAGGMRAGVLTALPGNAHILGVCMDLGLLVIITAIVPQRLYKNNDERDQFQRFGASAEHLPAFVVVVSTPEAVEEWAPHFDGSSVEPREIVAPPNTDLVRLHLSGIILPGDVIAVPEGHQNIADLLLAFPGEYEPTLASTVQLPYAGNFIGARRRQVKITANLCHHVPSPRQVSEHLNLLGHMVVRGVAVSEAQVIDMMGGDATLMNYKAGNAARPALHSDSRAVAVTAWPAESPILPHCELNYAPEFPSIVSFLVEALPKSGGETTLFDCQQAFQKLSLETQEYLKREKFSVVRLYVYRSDHPSALCWQQAFGKVALEDAMVRFEAQGYTCAVRKDPQTGEAMLETKRQVPMAYQTGTPTAWCVNPSAVGARNSWYQKILGDSPQPMDFCLSDGSPVPASLMDEVQDAVLRSRLFYAAQEGDTVMVNNHRVAHGRTPFRKPSRPRRIGVLMGSPSHYDINDQGHSTVVRSRSFSSLATHNRHPWSVLKLDLETSFFDMPELESLVMEGGSSLTSVTCVDEAGLIEAVRQHKPCVLVVAKTPISRKILDAGLEVGLRAIVKCGTGVDNIDTTRCAELGVKVLTVDDYAKHAVAEMAVGMLLSLARKLHLIPPRLAASGWGGDWDELQGVEMNGKVMGLIGYGRIGQTVASIAGGLGMRTVWYDPDAPSSTGQGKLDTLQDLLAISDVVSLHCALTSSTKNLLSLTEFSAMKPTAFVVNVSRGGLVDEDALHTALTKQTIAGAALDVMSLEPATKETLARFHLPNVLITPHQAWNTKDAGLKLQQRVADHVLSELRLCANHGSGNEGKKSSSTVSAKFTGVTVTDCRVTAVDCKALIDGTGQIIYDARVLVEKDRIVNVGPKTSTHAPADATYIDLRDLFMLPGLIDTHVHPFLWHQDYQAEHLRRSSGYKVLKGLNAIQGLLHHGWTGLRVAGDPDRGFGIADLMQAVEDGIVQSPRLTGACHYISVTGGIGDNNTISPELCMCSHADGVIADGPEEIIKAVRREKKYGAKWIKILASGTFSDGAGGLVDMPMSEREIHAAVDEATRLDLPVMAHAHSPSAIRACVRAGVRSIEHGSFIDLETAQLMVEKDCFLVPTLSIQEWAKESFSQEPGGPREAMLNALVSHQSISRECIRGAIKQGVKVALGTDYIGWPPAFSAREFSLLSEVGLTPSESIQAGTSRAAELLGNANVGSVEKGKLADMIAVPRDPLRDLSVLADVKFVMKGGQVVRHDNTEC